MVARLPLVMVAGQVQQFQAGDLIDTQVIPGTNNGDLALILVSQLIAQVAAGGSALINPELVEIANLVQSQLSFPVTPLAS